jgi:hypothetical protein
MISMRRSDCDFITLQVHLHNETTKAFCVSRTMVGEPQVWVPKSLTLLGQPTELGRWLIKLPIWLAKQKGLLIATDRRRERRTKLRRNF